jgi:polygalacturonase
MTIWRNGLTLMMLAGALAFGNGCGSSPAKPVESNDNDGLTPASGAIITDLFLSRTNVDVKLYGAVGDGKTVDTDAINKAIEAASSAGGGTVRISAGTYLSASIHLKSNITLDIEAGAVLLAASPTQAAFDPPEPNSARYQDFGHSHWHNSLIWGDGLENVAIEGPGLIYGKGLDKGQDANGRYRDPPTGTGNKAIALKNCHNVTLRDFSILHGGHFGILTTGVDNLTIDNLKIDTNRDGMDIDGGHNIRITRCSVNSPWDDGICPKTTDALGTVRALDDLTIDNCYVTGGLIEGTLIDGTFKRAPARYAGRNGRIKFGTESDGDFKNITISNCVFDDSGGLALESVDGGTIENVTITNIAMRDICNSPIFIRLGSRLRGPSNPAVGAIRHVNISDIVVSGADQRLGSIITGVPGHPVQDIHISNMQILQNGGGTQQEAAARPQEKEKDYPDPGMFGAMPSYGFYIRHAMGMQFTNVQVLTQKPDPRPAFVLDDVQGADFQHVTWQAGAPGSAFSLENVADFSALLCPALPDTRVASVANQHY